VVGDAAKDLPLFLYGFEGALEDNIKRKHDEIQSFVTATMRGSRWAITNPADAALVSEKILPDTPKELLETTAQAYAKNRFFSETGVMDPKAWAFTNDWMVKNGYLPKPYPYADIVDLEFVDAANKRLGPPT
jgi:ABC-type nitrate/sulfonate/bicarbonate transport system substrate-binding protein